LIHRDATLRLFDPATDPEGIPASLRHPRRTEWFARGEVTQRIYEALRDQGVISPRQVASAAIEAKQHPPPDSATKRDIINRFTNVLYDLTRRRIAEKIGHGSGARRKIAPDDPELLKWLSQKSSVR
jgi:hypothetical protein